MVVIASQELFAKPGICLPHGLFYTLTIAAAASS
jgi:hypothetical protein